MTPDSVPCRASFNTPAGTAAAAGLRPALATRITKKTTTS